MTQQNTDSNLFVESMIIVCFICPHFALVCKDGFEKKKKEKKWRGGGAVGVGGGAGGK